VKCVNTADVRRVLTSDALADAVIRYAAALSLSALSDVVLLPTVDAYGIRINVEIFLAPTTAVAVEPALDDELEDALEDHALLRELELRTGVALAFLPTGVAQPLT